MKVQILSDTHWERLRGRYPVPDIAVTDADTVVLAGDIDEGVEGIRWAKRQAERLGIPILYVPGNHEYYSRASCEDIRQALRRCAKGSRVHFLDNHEIVLGGVRYLGTTLWSGYQGGDPRLMRIAEAHMNDFSYITSERWRNTAAGRRAAAQRAYRPSTDGRVFPEFFLARHRRAVTWLRKKLAEPFDGPTVVITHHAPTIRSLALDPTDRLLSPESWRAPRLHEDIELVRLAGYVNDLDDLLWAYRRQIALWIHGHLHEPVDLASGGVRVVSNPRGYPLGTLATLPSVGHRRASPTDGDQPRFKADFTVDLSAGLDAALWPQVQRALAEQAKITEEALSLKPYGAHEDRRVGDLAAFRVRELAERFNALTNRILRPYVDNLMPPPGNRNRADVTSGEWLPLKQWVGVDRLALPDHFEGGVNETAPYFEQLHVPSRYMDAVLRAMGEVDQALRAHLPTLVRDQRDREDSGHGYPIIDWEDEAEGSQAAKPPGEAGSRRSD